MAGIKPDALSRLSGTDLLKHDGVLVFGPNGELVHRLRVGMASAVTGSRSDAEIVRLSTADVEAQPGRLLEELQSVSLFGGFKVVLLEAVGAAAQRDVVSATSIGWSGALLIVAAGDLKKSSPLRKEFEASPRLLAAICYDQSASELAGVASRLLSASDIDASTEVCVAIVDSVSGNAALLESEVEKLIVYAGGSGVLTLADVEAASALNRSSSLDRVIDLALGGRAALALAGLRELRAEGASSTSALIGLSNHLLMLAEMASASGGGRRADAVVKQWKPPVFWKRQDGVIDQVRRLAGSDQIAVLEAARAANSLARRQRNVEWPVLERLVLAVSSRLK